MSQSDGAVDNQLDALISRIQSLSGGDGEAKTSPPAKPTGSKKPAPPQGNGPAPANPRRPAGPPKQQRPEGGQRPRPTGKPGAPPPKPKPKAEDKGQGGPKQSATAKIEIPEGPLGFKSSRNEVWRPIEPADMESAGINETILEAIVYRYLQNVGEAAGRQISTQVKVPFRMIEPLMTRLKMEQNVAYKNATATNDYVYVLTETGRNIARDHVNDCTYYGACPVQLDDYIKSVRYQTIEGQYPKRDDLLRAFSDLLINPNMLKKLGPAVASGRGMFFVWFSWEW